MKWIKRLLLVSAVVVMVFIAAIVLFVTLVDPNDYKQLIVEEVQKATGRELTLEGDIELSLFPWLGLSLGAAQLSNAPGFGEAPFAGIEEAQVRVALLPLFTGEVRADTVRLIGLKVNLSRNKHGVSNWDDLIAKGDEKPEPAPEPNDAPTGEKKPLALAIGGIEVQQAALHWQDAQSGTDVKIDPFNLKTGALTPGEPFELKMDLRAFNQAPEIEAGVKLTGRINLDLEGKRYRISNLKTDIIAQGETLPKGEIEASLSADVEADLQSQTARIAALNIETFSLQLDGNLEATQILDAAQIKGQLASKEFSPSELLEQLGQAPLQTADSKVLKKAKFDLAFDANPDAVSLSRLDVLLDDTKIAAKGNIKSFEKPQIDFSVDIDEIDVDRYMPPKQDKTVQEKSPASKPAPTKEVDDKIALPVDMLRSLNLKGKLTMGKLKAVNLRMNKLSATMSAKDGLVELKPVKTSLYKGILDSGIKLDVRKETPVYGIRTNLEKVALGELITDLQEDKAYIRGVGNLSFNLTTWGNRVSGLKKQLGGKLKLAVTDGALRDRELAAKVERVIAFLKGREPAASGEELIFEGLTGSANIKKGVVRNDDLNLITALILARGKGEVSLVEESIDYELGIALAGGDKDKERLFVPITMKGPFTDLKYGLDLEKVAKERLKKEVDRKKQKVQEKIDKKIKEKQDDLQKKLEGELMDKLKF